jgi:hypothetical protein
LKHFLGTPSLSSQGTITFKVISRNEYSPICDINNNISWSIMENSEFGRILGTISCRDDDKDELNGQISVYSHWFPEGKSDHQNRHGIPFEIVTRKSNTSEVINTFEVVQENPYVKFCIFSQQHS